MLNNAEIRSEERNYPKLNEINEKLSVLTQYIDKLTNILSTNVSEMKDITNAFNTGDGIIRCHKNHEGPSLQSAGAAWKKTREIAKEIPSTNTTKYRNLDGETSVKNKALKCFQ